MRKAYALLMVFFLLLAALGAWTIAEGAVSYRNRPLLQEYTQRQGSLG